MRAWQLLRIPLETDSATSPPASAASCGAPRVDDVDVPEPRDRRPMADRVHLHGLTLRIPERAAEEVALRSADHVERGPEIRRAHLIGDVLQHADDLAALDL